MADITNLIAALAQLTQAMGQQQQQNPPTATPKISVQIPPFKGESKENVVA
ncbi:1547_t:CDS:1, partial [Entrophospora sp. SA101]